MSMPKGNKLEAEISKNFQKYGLKNKAKLLFLIHRSQLRGELQRVSLKPVPKRRKLLRPGQCIRLQLCTWLHRAVLRNGRGRVRDGRSMPQRRRMYRRSRPGFYLPVHRRLRRQVLRPGNRRVRIVSMSERWNLYRQVR